MPCCFKDYGNKIVLVYPLTKILGPNINKNRESHFHCVWTRMWHKKIQENEAVIRTGHQREQEVTHKEEKNQTSKVYFKQLLIWSQPCWSWLSTLRIRLYIL